MRNPLLAGLRPVHPGEILREDVLPAVGKPKTEIARALRVSRQTLYDVLAERNPITPNLALRIAKMFGSNAEFWLRLQASFDLAILEKEMAEELAAIPHLQAA